MIYFCYFALSYFVCWYISMHKLICVYRCVVLLSYLIVIIGRRLKYKSCEFVLKFVLTLNYCIHENIHSPSIK